MSTDAPGQFLGYVLQIPRALYHLLTSNSGDVVCVEFNGDVYKESKDAEVVAEEDKSSVNSNPLTNKSSNLWKTFFNWITAVKNEQLDIEKTKFLLYTNKRGEAGVVDSFHESSNSEEALKAIEAARVILKDLDDKHEAWRYYDFVVNKNIDIFAEIIKKFEFQISDGAGYEEVENQLRSMFVHDKKIKYLCNGLSGWVLRELSEKIKNKELPQIKGEEFRSQFTVQFERVRNSELIDFTLHEEIKEEEIEYQVRTKPIYLKQLDAILSDSDEEVEAVSDFLRAKVNRDKWIEAEILDEEVADDFQKKLTSFWVNTRKRINIANKGLSEEEQGQLLLLDCKNRQESLRGVSPPASTISGTYHALSNELIIGWHPRWKKMFNK